MHVLSQALAKYALAEILSLQVFANMILQAFASFGTLGKYSFYSVSQCFAMFCNLQFSKVLQSFTRFCMCQNYGFSQGFAMCTLLMIGFTPLSSCANFAPTETTPICRGVNLNGPILEWLGIGGIWGISDTFRCVVSWGPIVFPNPIS